MERLSLSKEEEVFGLYVCLLPIAYCLSCLASLGNVELSPLLAWRGEMACWGKYLRCGVGDINYECLWLFFPLFFSLSLLFFS